MALKRLFDLLPYLTQNLNKPDVLIGKYGGKWLPFSTQEYVTYSDDVSYALLSLGIQKGDKVATISINRPEINFIEMGALQIGAIHVPIYPTISESDYRYILTHCDAKFLFFSGEDIYRKIMHILPEITAIKHVYCLRQVDHFGTFADMIAIGRKNINYEKLEALKGSVNTDDVALIIYTSGTTGFPKGAMLSHNNIISNVEASSYIPRGMGINSRALSFLPMCHVYEKMLTYLYQYLGISVYYAENIGTVAENINEIRPDIMSTVPRFIDKIYYRFISKGRKLPKFKKSIYFWAINLAKRFELNHANGFIYDIKLKIADKLIFRKWRDAMGGNLKLIVSGGAALQPVYSRIFWAAGFNLMEGYGMTETSPVIAVYNYEPGGMKFGTVGQVLRGVKVKIAPDSEILCKGPNVMKGYYKDEKLTKEVFDSEGWFHTGDLGRLEDDNLLRITGRKKDLFKTSHGKYIVPQFIENKFRESPFIDNIMVIGESRKYAAAIIVPDFNDLRSWCANKNILYVNDREMIKAPRIIKRYQKEVNIYNTFFSEEEQIKKFELIDYEWTIPGGELTPTLKLKRHIIMDRHKDIINKLYKSSTSIENL